MRREKKMTTLEKEGIIKEWKFKNKKERRKVKRTYADEREVKKGKKIRTDNDERERKLESQKKKKEEETDLKRKRLVNVLRWIRPITTVERSILNCVALGRP